MNEIDLRLPSLDRPPSSTSSACTNHVSRAKKAAPPLDSKPGDAKRLRLSKTAIVVVVDPRSPRNHLPPSPDNEDDDDHDDKAPKQSRGRRSSKLHSVDASSAAAAPYVTDLVIDPATPRPTEAWAAPNINKDAKINKDEIVLLHCVCDAELEQHQSKCKKKRCTTRQIDGDSALMAHRRASQARH
jgi:hypothetical protein